MNRTTGFEQFCGGQFWNSSLLWENYWPQFTTCFITTVLVWVPCGYVWLLFPYVLHDVKNELSTNNVYPVTIKKNNATLHPGNIVNKLIANGGTLKSAKKNRTTPLSVICVLKIIFTLLLAFLSLLQLAFGFVDLSLASQLVACILYTSTYILVTFQLWYERRNGRNPLFVSFYFYTMNIIFGIVPLYTWLITEQYQTKLGQFCVFVSAFVLNFFCFVLSFIPDNPIKTGAAGYQNLESVRLKAGALSWKTVHQLFQNVQESPPSPLSP